MATDSPSDTPAQRDTAAAPTTARRRGLARRLPRTQAHWISAGMLAAFMVVYCLVWVVRNQGVLFDPGRQTDDVRTTWVAFHADGNEALLADDPITQSMRGFVPPVVKMLSIAAVKMTDVYVAPKIIQNLALLLLIVAVALVLRSPYGGLAPAAVMLFLFLHTHVVLDRLYSGLPRSFGYPALALWIAGVICRSTRIRFAAAIVAVLSYPQVWAVLMATEGIYTVCNCGWDWTALKKQLLRYGGLVLLSAVLLAPQAIMMRDHGPVHTLEQGLANPAFHQNGRLKVFPLTPPTAEFGEWFAVPVAPPREKYVDSGGVSRGATILLVPCVLMGVVFVGIAAGVLPFSRAVWCLVLGSAVVYCAAVLFAFRLQNPARPYEYGMVAACIALCATAVAGAWPHVKRRRLRLVWQNATALGLILLIFALTHPLKPLNPTRGTLRAPDADLYAFVESLPPDVRIAQHPYDGVGIPYWTGRATLDSYETLQPWFVEDWARYQARTEDTFRALYATDRETLLDYTEKYGITHLLLGKARYNAQVYRQLARTFEPFDTFVAQLLDGVTVDQLVVRSIPADAPRSVVFMSDELIIVDVAELRRAWRQTPLPSPTAP